MVELLLKLEMSLWINETRNSFDYMSGVLHDDFVEFGKSGKTFNKEDILNDLSLDILTKFPFLNLVVKQVDTTTFLVTYTAQVYDENELILSNRSSIWVGKENFQLLFHQGTITK